MMWCDVYESLKRVYNDVILWILFSKWNNIGDLIVVISLLFSSSPHWSFSSLFVLISILVLVPFILLLTLVAHCSYPCLSSSRKSPQFIHQIFRLLCSSHPNFRRDWMNFPLERSHSWCDNDQQVNEHVPLRWTKVQSFYTPNHDPLLNLSVSSAFPLICCIFVQTREQDQKS